MKIFIVLCLLLSFQSEGAIEDNSFLLEEAFNQKSGEYQFINNYQSSTEGSQEYFLQVEVPLSHETHQLSAEVSYGETSFSDTQLNYRYQAFNKLGLILTERFSFVLPTASGEYGLAFMQSATIALNDRFMNHWNLGGSFIPEKDHFDFSAGSSLVYLYKDDLNFLIEALYDTFESETSLYLNPGLRCAIDRPNSQIVPGIAFPFQYTEDRVYSGVFLYLSIEATLY